MAFSANSPDVRFNIRANDKTKKAFSSVNKNLARMGGRLKIVGTLLGGAAFAQSLKITAQFEKSISDLSAITGATGRQLQFLSKSAREMGAVTTLSASQAAEAFKLVASGKPELLASSEALAAVTRETVLLAEAAGIEMPEAANSLTQALNQYSAGAEEANRFINVLAAGSKFGASEIASTSEALEKVGTVASIAGISFEELNANIQGLAAVALKGSDAGTALRNAILRLQDQSNKDFNPAIVGLTQAFKNLNDSNLGTVEIMDLVGVRTIAATQALMRQAEGLEVLEGKLTDTKVAEEQAAIRTDNLTGDVKRLQAAYEELSIHLLDDLTPALRTATQWITNLINSSVPGKVKIDTLRESLEKLRASAEGKAGVTGNSRRARRQRGGGGNVEAAEADLLLALEEMGGVVGLSTKLDRLEAQYDAAKAKQIKGDRGGRLSKLRKEIELTRAELEEISLDMTESGVVGGTGNQVGEDERRAQALAEEQERERTVAQEKVQKAAERAAEELAQEKIRLSNKLELIQVGLMNEQDAETSAFLNRLMVLEENRELELISLSTFLKVKENLEKQHEEKLEDFKKKKWSQERKDWDSGQQGKLKVLSGVMGDMTVLMDTNSKKMFAIGKAAAISQTIIDTYAAAQASYKALAGIPVVGPALGAAAAAAAIVGGMARVQGISAQQFGGGGSVTAAGSAGGGTAVPVVPVDSISGLPSSSQAGNQGSTEVTINFGSQALFTTEQVRTLIEEINEQIEDGVNVAAIRVA